LEQTNNLGYAKSKKIAKTAGKELEDDILLTDEAEEEEDEAENGELNLAGKYFRFFTHSEGENFALFVEHGINREIEATLSPDHHSIDLNVKIPLPPDGLLQAAEFHASTAHLNEVDEIFQIDSPKKLDPTTKKMIHYPKPNLPVWVIFWYKFAVEKEEVVDKCTVDLSSLLFNEYNFV
jgi:hypothetical protein